MKFIHVYTVLRERERRIHAGVMVSFPRRSIRILIPRIILILILIPVHAGVVASFPERAKEQLLRLNLDGPVEQVCICVCVRS
jgi:hypothetical protein